MAEVTERKNLEAAIAEAKVKGLTRIGGEPWSTVPEGTLHVILAAAEAHLATLPEPRPAFKMRIWERGKETTGEPYCYIDWSDVLNSLSMPPGSHVRKIEIEIP